jgi:ketosteroid isomerase-like protein
MKQLLFLSASSLVLFMACKQADTTTASQAPAFSVDSARQEIAAANEKFGEAVAKGDSAAVVNFYTADGEVYVPNMPKISAKQMGSGVIQMPAMGIRKMVLSSVEVAGGPEIVTETGTYEMSDSTKPIEKGKYIVLWKKEDGRWKIYRDIWNSDEPAMAMTPAKK